MLVESEVQRGTSPEARRVKLPERSRASEISNFLHQRVFGQDEACDAIANKVLSAQEYPRPGKPKGVIFGVGPTGVGKTESAIALAKYLHGKDWERHCKIINGTEFQEKHTMTRLLGAPPSYVGYGDPPLIDSKFLSQKDTVIVFDEVEKMHPDIQRILLPILDKAKAEVSESSGTSFRGSQVTQKTTLNFEESYVFMTSNIGAREINGQQTGFLPTSENDRKKLAVSEYKKYFQGIPELRGRIGDDNVIVYNKLSHSALKHVVGKFISDINEEQQRLPRQNPLQVEIGAVNWILARANTEELGGREIGNVIDRFIVPKAAEVKLLENVNNGDTISINYNKYADPEEQWEFTLLSADEATLQVLAKKPDSQRQTTIAEFFKSKFNKIKNMTPRERDIFLAKTQISIELASAGLVVIMSAYELGSRVKKDKK